MALDTADKRASALNVGLGLGRAFWSPDNSMSQADRQHAALSYRGILAGAPTLVIPPFLEYTALPRNLDFAAPEPR